MARARNIKPGFYKNEDLAECSVWARYIFPGLWMLADREGRLEDRPKRIKGELLPFDAQDVEPLLKELTARGFILRYQMDGASYIQILKFKEHQSPHYSEKQSVIKGPLLPENERSISPSISRSAKASMNTALQEHSEKPPPIKRGAQPPDSLNPDSLNPESLGKAARKPRETPIPADFSISERVRQWAEDKGHERLDAYLEFFAGRMKANGKRYIDWDEAFMNCIREDWPKLRGGNAGSPDYTELWDKLGVPHDAR